jgi:hypothetical protein
MRIRFPNVDTSKIKCIECRFALKINSENDIIECTLRIQYECA